MAKRKEKSTATERDNAGAVEAEQQSTTEEPEAPGIEEATTAEEEDPVAPLEAEVASLKDQLLRALADTENLRRRSQRERADVVKYAAAPLIKDLITVADNLRRALDSVPPEATDSGAQLKTLLTGVEMTEKELHAVFEKHQIVKIDPLGERLDPHFHEAMFEIPNPETPAGTVLQVVQAGYRLHDRLLRPAQVGVAKGGPTPAPSAQQGEAAKSETEPGSAEPGGPKGGETPGAATGDDSAPGSRVDTTA